MYLLSQTELTGLTELTAGQSDVYVVSATRLDSVSHYRAPANKAVTALKETLSTLQSILPRNPCHE